MATYKTPGVYVEEVSTLPPSVAPVATAIPAFIGYTERGPDVARIDTMLEYETTFGGAKPTGFNVTLQPGGDDTQTASVSPVAGPEFLMYYSVSHYFKNGGGACYIISIGDYSSPPSKDDFLEGLANLEQEDEPTIIAFPDATKLVDADHYEVAQQALAQCAKLGDRFTILDVSDNDQDIDNGFRSGVGNDNLMYGAAYTPYLITAINHQYDESSVSIDASGIGGSGSTHELAAGADGIIVLYGGGGDDPRVKIVAGTESEEVEISISSTNLLTLANVGGKTGLEVAGAWQTWKSANEAAGFDVVPGGSGNGDVPSSSNANLELQARSGPPSVSLAEIKTTQTALYNQVKASLAQQRVVLPPSPAVAGVYARVDRDRGVWKAPANVSVLSVIGPTRKITSQDQETLNVDATAGKSVNAIRAFTGKGTLVWGARTLAGNDNEWRYISVRRLFNLIEESAQKSTAFAVFEPNDLTTWLRVKAMIESYLYGLWEQGAFAGSTPEAAYQVTVGLGKTMTQQDVLEGRMIVEIGAAAVRPSEFILLRFMHKMQEA